MGPAGIRAVKHYRRCLCVNQKKHTLWRGDPAPCSMGLIIESQAGFQSTVAPSLQTPEGYMLCSCVLSPTQCERGEVLGVRGITPADRI